MMHYHEDVKAGAVVTSDRALERVGSFYRVGMGVGGPVPFVSDALKAWAPEIWEKIWND